MSKLFFSIFLSIIFLVPISGQGSVFGPKGGFTLGLQNWNGFKRDPLIAYHGAFFIESYNPEGQASLFGQVGFHPRGSSEDVFFFTGGGTGFRDQISFKFNNLAGVFGARKKLSSGSSTSSPYFGFGLRLEYTISTNLDQIEEYIGYFPTEVYVNKFNYGGYASIGYEFGFSELTGAFIEASISPDFSKQYEQPGGIGVISPITGNPIALREESIRNITFEISVGFRFTHKIIYLD